MKENEGKEKRKYGWFVLPKRRTLMQHKKSHRKWDTTMYPITPDYTVNGTRYDSGPLRR